MYEGDGEGGQLLKEKIIQEDKKTFYRTALFNSKNCLSLENGRKF